jgi:hypothetical protein
MKTVLLLALAATTLPLHANGGGFFRGGVARAGDLELFEPAEVEKIRILDEKLTVELGKEEAAVEVRYLMRNETGKKVTVRFGFPVEELFDNDLMDAGEPMATPSKGDALRYCRDYALTAGGKPVKAKWQGEGKSSDDERFKGIAGWLVSELTFAANEEKPVMIRFRSGYPMEEWSVSEDTRVSPRIFKYRLSTAACWAATIGSGRIVLKPAGIPPEELKVLKPVNRFKKEGDSWVWNFENLEPALADDLEIEAAPAYNTYGRSLGDPLRYENGGNFATYIERGGKWSMSHSNYDITASSTLPDDGNLSYAAANVQSFWDDQTWSEGAPGPGSGEWLLLTPKVAKPLAAIGLQPGYAKSDELFRANARPKRIRVELNGEHRFHADIPDSKDVFEIPVKGYAKPVKSVKLVVEDVWKGSKHEDLCISGVVLHVRLDKKPEIQPAR